MITITSLIKLIYENELEFFTQSQKDAPISELLRLMNHKVALQDLLIRMQAAELEKMQNSVKAA